MQRNVTARWVSVGTKLLVMVVLANAGWADDVTPPTKRNAVYNLPGSVLLAGGVFTDEMGEEFVRLAGGKDARIVLIPTAYGPTEEEGVEQFFVQWGRWKPASIEILHTRNRAVANDAKFAAPLRKATGVWFLGGVQSRLLDVYEGTLVHKELHALFQRGAAVGGNCAGAMALGETMIVEGDERATIRAGLGIVPKLIADSHFLEGNRLERLRGAVEDHPDHFGIGIDRETAFIVEKGKFRVIGKSYVMTVSHQAARDRSRIDIWAAGDTTEFKVFIAASSPK